VTVVLIIVCVVFCIGIVLGTVGHLGAGIADDKSWRRRIAAHHARKRGRRHKLTN